MSRRRIIFYSGLFFIAGGLLFWQWWTEPRHEGRRLNDWLAHVNDPEVATRAEAATALGRLGNNSDDAWKELVRLALRDPDKEVRVKAVEALRHLCQTAHPQPDAKWLARKRKALQVLVDALHDENEDVRFNAPAAVYEAGGLWFQGQAVRRMNDDEVDKELRPAALKALAATAADSDSDVRNEVLRILAHAIDIPADPALCAAASRVIGDKSYDPEVRTNALIVMTRLHELPDDVIPSLIVAVQDDVPAVRKEALTCILGLGKRPIPALRAALDKAPERTRSLLQDVLSALSEKSDP